MIPSVCTTFISVAKIATTNQRGGSKSVISLTRILAHHYFFLKIAWLFFYVYEYFAYTYVYILCMCSWKPEEGTGYSRNCSYKLFFAPHVDAGNGTWHF